jgi:hypothetical protein
MYQGGRDGHDFYDCYNPIIHRTNYGPITCCANSGIPNGDCFTWNLANPNPTGSPAPTGSVAPTPGPGEPAAGTLQAACTGGASPQLTVKWSKSPPPGSTGELNPGNPAVLNRTLDGAAAQINPSATDKGSYWEWVDNASPPVTSGSTVSYTGKYGPNVKTNTVTVVASPANCGAATPTPTATSTPTRTPTPTPTRTPSPTPVSLALDATVLNVSTQTGGGDVVSALCAQQVEITARVRNGAGSTIARSATLRTALPDGLSYVNGTTSLNGATVALDSVSTSGISLGALSPGQEATVRFRLRVSCPPFPVGVSQATVVVTATAQGVPEANDSVRVDVTRQSTVPTQTTTVPTGPGEAVLVAFLMSSIVTLLYVSYTHSSLYRRREAEELSGDQGPLDFKG